MTDTQREAALEAFGNGAAQVLVCTAAVEEGLDVSSCDVVVRFNTVRTTKAHIQGAGRARALQAKVHYFCNDPEDNVRKAELMQNVARQAGHWVP